jgi:hypothetical protein
MQFRNINSLPNIIDGGVLGVFVNESNANMANKSSQFCEINFDRRRPHDSVEVYYKSEEPDYEERKKEQEEFDKIFR